MNNSPAILLALALAVLLGALPARLDAQEKPPVPKAPFIKNAAPHAAWTIEHRRNDQEGSSRKEGDSPERASRVTLVRSEVTKFGPDRREVEEWSDGSKVEKWFYKGHHIFQQRGSKDIYVIDSSKDQFQRLTFPDYSKEDFPELNWLSAETFIGDEVYQGRTSHVFQRADGAVSGPILAQIKAATGTDVAQPTTTAPKRMMRVLIDAQALLPVAINNGVRTKVYTFRSAPSVAAQPPAEFVEALQRYQAARTAPAR